MKGTAKQFEKILMEAYPENYYQDVKLSFEEDVPFLRINGVKYEVERNSWDAIFESSELSDCCIGCLSKEPIEVIALPERNVVDPKYLLLAFYKDGIGCHYNPDIMKKD